MSRRSAATLSLLCAALWSVFLSTCAGAPLPTRAQLRQLPYVSPDVSPTALPEVGTTLTVAVTHAPPDGLTAVDVFSPTLSPPLRLRRLTDGGCCPQPFWSADSRYVQFIDRPASRRLGIYQVDVQGVEPPALVTDWIVTISGGGAFYVYPEGNTSVVQRTATGEKHVIPNGGRPISVSPNGQRLLWQVIDQRGNFDQRRSQTWVADIDGSHARIVGETAGLSWSEWIDSQRVLLVGLPLENLPFVSIAALTLGADARSDRLVELARVARPRETLISPDGSWLVYLLSFQIDAGDDGLWIVRTDGSQPPRKLGFFGGYRWRDATHLLYVPMELDVKSHTLWEYDVVADESRRLTDPAQISFKIANNDWAVSPNGRYIVFVHAADHNLWLIDLQP